VAGTHLLILSAIKVTTPATPLRPLLVNREAARYEIACLGLGITATFAVAAYPLALVALIPVVLLLHKHLTGTAPTLSTLSPHTAPHPAPAFQQPPPQQATYAQVTRTSTPTSPDTHPGGSMRDLR
jgi:hypothetical protein